VPAVRINGVSDRYKAKIKGSGYGMTKEEHGKEHELELTDMMLHMDDDDEPGSFFNDSFASLQSE